MSSTIIKVRGVGKSFGQNKILNDISFDVYEGEIFGIIGESGSGKSTLLRCLNGLLKPDVGSIKIHELEITSMNQKELNFLRHNVGMIFQHFSLVNRLNVHSNIALPLRIKNVDEKIIDKKIEEITSKMGIFNKLNQTPSSLSGGQKQRVAIARALITEPSIILSDESTSALDPENKRAILDLLKRLNTEIKVTIILVSHEMDAIRYCCDRVMSIEKGSIQEISHPKEYFFKRFVSKKEYDKKVLSIAINTNLQTKTLKFLFKYSTDDIEILDSDTFEFKDERVAFYDLSIGHFELGFEMVKEYFLKNNILWEVHES